MNNNQKRIFSLLYMSLEQYDRRDGGERWFMIREFITYVERVIRGVKRPYKPHYNHIDAFLREAKMIMIASDATIEDMVLVLEKLGEIYQE